MTLVTGSKFFEGPPFSGAVVLPPNMAEEIECHVRSYAEAVRAAQSTGTVYIRADIISFEQCKSFTYTAVMINAYSTVPSFSIQKQRTSKISKIFFISFLISVFLTGTPPSAVCAVPIGLMDYITPYDVCETMPALREYLTAKLPEGGTISEVIHFH